MNRRTKKSPVKVELLGVGLTKKQRAIASESLSNLMTSAGFKQFPDGSWGVDRSKKKGGKR